MLADEPKRFQYLKLYAALWDDKKEIIKNIKDDLFIHFTPKDRAEQIVESGKLLFNPPYEKFGIEAIGAISAIWGEFVPGVQTTHIDGDDIVAVLFKTNSIPKYGYVEEVLWGNDVALINPQIISKEDAIKILRTNGSQVLESDRIRYE